MLIQYPILPEIYKTGKMYNLPGFNVRKLSLILLDTGVMIFEAPLYSRATGPLAQPLKLLNFKIHHL